MEAIALEISLAIHSDSFEGMGKYSQEKKHFNKKELIKELGKHQGKDHVGALLTHLNAYQGNIRNKEEFQLFAEWMPVKSQSRNRYLTQLRNLLPEFKEYVTVKPRSRKEPKRGIDPFTVDEVRAILEALKGNRYYPVIAFLARTGCRPEEAIGLRWHNIQEGNNRIKFCEVLAKKVGKKERVRIDKTKNGKDRYFPLNDELMEILNLCDKGNESVFTEPNGGAIKAELVTHKWKHTLKRLGIAHRPVYNLRHSFISHCLARGLEVAEVAQLVGNTPEIIYKHYAGVARELTVPNFY